MSRENEISSHHESQIKKLRGTYEDQLLSLRSNATSSSTEASTKAVAVERAEWEAKIARLTATSNDHEKRATRLASQLTSLQDDNARELAEAIKRERQLISDNATLKESVDKLRNDTSQQLSSSTTQINRLTSECSELERKLKASTDQLSHSNITFTEKSNELHAITSQLNESRASYRALESRLEAERKAAKEAAAKNEEKFNAALMAHTPTGGTGDDGINSGMPLHHIEHVEDRTPLTDYYVCNE
jgi:chromosome segregation ATPase